MVNKKVFFIISIISIALLGLLYKYPCMVGLRRRQTVCIGPHCGESGGDIEILEDELGLCERWRAHSKEELVSFYSQSTDSSNEHIARQGVLVTRPHARATILVMHGYTSDKADMGIFRLLFSPYNILLFDFRAHGEDIEGQISTLGRDEVHDVLAAVDYIKSHSDIKHLPLIGYGFSMGAATAIEANSRDATLFDAFILDCPFDSTDALIKRGLDKFFGKINIPWLGLEYEVPGRTFLEKYATHPYVQPLLLFLLRFFAGMDSTKVLTMPKRVNPIESAKNIRIPAQIIACYADERIPIDAVAQLYQNIPTYKRLWITKGARHFGSLFNNPELYQQMITNFIEKVLNNMIQRDRPERIINDVSAKELSYMHNKLYEHHIPQGTYDFLYSSK